MNDWTVCRQSLISGKQDELLDVRLRDQHPIERIPMAPWKRGNLPGLRSSQGQALKGFGGQLFCEVRRQTQFAQALLKPDFPKGDGTNKHRILRVADHLLGLRAERRIGLQPPEQEVGVQKDPQLRGSLIPKASAISSGIVSKSGAIQISPAIEPGVRGREEPRKAISLATGLPALAMMTSFPFWTASMSAESSALASEILRTIIVDVNTNQIWSGLI